MPSVSTKTPIVNFTTPQEAENAFYEAFANADLDNMMAIWAEDEELLCTHPGGARFNDYAAIREAWRSVFEQNMAVEIQVMQIAVWSTLTLAVHCVQEHFMPEDEDLPEITVLVTNVYSRGANGWRMVMHQISQTQHNENELSSVQHRIH